MLEVRSSGDGVVIVSGEVATTSVVGLRKEIEGRIIAKKGKSLTVNLAGIQTFNSVVLSLLLSFMRQANRVDCELSFQDVPSALFDMARVGGVESFLPSH